VIEPVPDTEALILDLDAYRKKREAAGTWPPTREDQYKFFYQWRQQRKK
jgi:hypothetical protein